MFINKHFINAVVIRNFRLFILFLCEEKDVHLERSYEIVTKNHFCVRHKNNKKHNQHFEQLFFMINLHFDISNYLNIEK